MHQLLSFPKDHFKTEIQRPLTTLMIQTLKLACDKQNRGVSFGPQDIKGSFISLINRGLIANHIVERRGKSKDAWYVTSRAIEMLAQANSKESC